MNVARGNSGKDSVPVAGKGGNINPLKTLVGGKQPGGSHITQIKHRISVRGLRETANMRFKLRNFKMRYEQINTAQNNSYG